MHKCCFNDCLWSNTASERSHADGRNGNQGRQCWQQEDKPLTFFPTLQPETEAQQQDWKTEGESNRCRL